MTSKQLRKILSVRATSRFGERIGRLIAREGLLAETIDLGTDPDPRIAFRVRGRPETNGTASERVRRPLRGSKLSWRAAAFLENPCAPASTEIPAAGRPAAGPDDRSHVRPDDRPLRPGSGQSLGHGNSSPAGRQAALDRRAARRHDPSSDGLRRFSRLMQPGPENLSPAERGRRSPLSARVPEAEYVRARHENMQASPEKPRARKPRPVTVSRNVKTDGYPYDPHSHSGRDPGSESPNPGRTAFRQILHRTESVREVVATRSPKERYGIPYSACAPGTTRLRRGYRGRQAHEPADRTADRIGPNRRPYRSGPAA